VLDDAKIALKSAFLEIAQTYKANFRFTCNQNLIVSDVKKEDKDTIEEILKRYGVDKHTENVSGLRANSIACVALNTCPLALAESQRYLPSLISKIETILEKYNLLKDEITLRMTGCPNGCARPFAAEIGFVGTTLGKYNMHISGDRNGLRLNTKYKESLGEAEILAELDSLFADYKKNSKKGEAFGDFTHRTVLKGDVVSRS
jgi:sulfite reductase (NADPH) hemoprotein beta-component